MVLISLLYDEVAPFVPRSGDSLASNTLKRQVAVKVVQSFPKAAFSITEAKDCKFDLVGDVFRRILNLLTLFLHIIVVVKMKWDYVFQSVSASSRNKRAKLKLARVSKCSERFIAEVHAYMHQLFAAYDNQINRKLYEGPEGTKRIESIKNMLHRGILTLFRVSHSPPARLDDPVMKQSNQLSARGPKRTLADVQWKRSPAGDESNQVDEPIEQPSPPKRRQVVRGNGDESKAIGVTSSSGKKDAAKVGASTSGGRSCPKQSKCAF